MLADINFSFEYLNNCKNKFLVVNALRAPIMQYFPPAKRLLQWGTTAENVGRSHMLA